MLSYPTVSANYLKDSLRHSWSYKNMTFNIKKPMMPCDEISEQPSIKWGK